MATPANQCKIITIIIIRVARAVNIYKSRVIQSRSVVKQFL
jgi:hypothetical protein